MDNAATIGSLSGRSKRIYMFSKHFQLTIIIHVYYVTFINWVDAKFQHLRHCHFIKFLI